MRVFFLGFFFISHPVEEVARGVVERVESRRWSGVDQALVRRRWGKRVVN